MIVNLISFEIVDLVYVLACDVVILSIINYRVYYLFRVWVLV